MPIYILLSRLSQQGVQTLKSNPERLKEVNRDVEELGARVLHQWATLGEFDFVNVVEAPDTATIARVSVALGARGSTRIETLPALTLDEFADALRLARSACFPDGASSRRMVRAEVTHSTSAHRARPSASSSSPTEDRWVEGSLSAWLPLLARPGVDRLLRPDRYAWPRSRAWRRSTPAAAASSFRRT